MCLFFSDNAWPFLGMPLDRGKTFFRPQDVPAVCEQFHIPFQLLGTKRILTKELDWKEMLRRRWEWADGALFSPNGKWQHGFFWGCCVNNNLLWFECCLLSDNPEAKQIKLAYQRIGGCMLQGGKVEFTPLIRPSPSICPSLSRVLIHSNSLTDN